MAQTLQTSDIDLLIGGYGSLQGSHGRGIELCTAHITDDGVASLHHQRLLSDVPSPSWLERYRVGGTVDMVYAVLENNRGLAALRIDDDHDSCRLTLVSHVAVIGDGPTHVAVATDDQGNAHAITANYVSGSISVFPINTDGSLGDVSQTLPGDPDEGHGPLPAQEGPHAHWILPLPDGRVLSTDLGADRIYVHRWMNGELVRTGMVRLAPGTGPRDMHLLPVASESNHFDEWRVAVVNEWGRTVTVLDANDLRILQTIDLDAEPADQAASLAFIPSANGYEGMAYVGLRGSDRIVALSWDGRTLTRRESVSSGEGRPRHLCAIGRYLIAANETQDHLTMFHSDETGHLTVAHDLPIGSPTVILPLQ